MNVPRTCPVCGEPLTVPDSARGSSVICRICAVEIPIPPASPPVDDIIEASVVPEAKPAAPVALPVAQAIPAAPAAAILAAPALPLAKALPATPAAAPVATPLAAPPVQMAKPLAPASRRRLAEEEDDEDAPQARPRPGRRNRDDDDEVDDNDDAKPKPPKSKAGLIIGILLMVMLGMVGVVVGGIWYLVKSDPAEVATIPTAPAQPAMNGPPAEPAPAVPGDWVDYTEGDGFAVSAPKGFSRKEVRFTVNGRNTTGYHYSGTESSTQCRCEIWYADLDQPVRPSLLKHVAALCSLPLDESHGGSQKMLGGKTGVDYRLEYSGNTYTLWATQLGNRLYVIGFMNPGVGGQSKTFNAQQQHFFNSLRLTHPGIAYPASPGSPGTKTDPKAVDQLWVLMPKTNGFRVKAPSNVTSQKHNVTVEKKTYGGMSYSSIDQGFVFTAYYHDYPKGQPIDLPKLLPVIAGGPQAAYESGPSASEVHGRPASDWVFRDFFKAPIYFRCMSSGTRLFTFSVSKQIGNSLGDSEQRRRFDAFVDSVRITFDSSAPENDLSREAGWAELPGTPGFKVVGPKGVRVEDDYKLGFGFGDNVVQGTRFTCEDDVMQIQIMVMPVNAKWTSNKIINTIIGNDKISDGPKESTLGGTAAEARTINDFFGNPILLRSAVLSQRMYIVRVSRKGSPPEKEFDDKLSRLFSTFKFDKNLIPNPDANPGTSPLPLLKGGLVFANKIEPFWSGVVLPKKGEFLAFGTQQIPGKNRGAVIRRYSYPDFKLKASYSLPSAVTRAVADEKAGRVYCAAITKDNPTLSERETAYLPADVLVLDLRKLTDGSMKEKEEAKPITSFSIGGIVSDLAMTSDSSTLFVGAQIPPPPGPAYARRNYKGNILRFDLDKLAADGDFNLTDPVQHLRLGSDDRRLLVTTIPLNAAGALNLQPGKPEQFMILEPRSFKRLAITPLPKPISDLTLLNDEAVMVWVDSGQVKTNLVKDDGKVTNLAPVIAGTPFDSLQATPDGNYCIGSVGKGSKGVYLLEVRGSSPDYKLGTIAFNDTYPEVNLGGAFVISPDSKFAILNCGVVVDIKKSTEK